jgi:hypothetical protein
MIPIIAKIVATRATRKATTNVAIAGVEFSGALLAIINAIRDNAAVAAAMSNHPHHERSDAL